MKKIFMISLTFMFVFLCCACNGTVTRDIRHAGFSVSSTFVCDVFYPKDKEDTSYNRIRYLLSNHIIDTNGKIFEISMGQKYQNNQNCKVADTNIVVKAIYDGSIIKAMDNKYYYLNNSNNVAAYTEVPQTDNSYYLYDMLLKDENVIKVLTADSSKGLYYVLKTDGNVYAYVVERPDRNSPAQVSSTSLVYSKNDYMADIIDFNYAGNNLATFVRTNNKVFRMRITNSEQCSKYVDVSCEFAMKEDEMFEKYADRIIVYNGSLLITDYKQIFSVSS